MEPIAKFLAKEIVQLVIFVFCVGAFWASTRNDLANIAKTLEAEAKESAEYRKDFSTRLESLEQRQATTEFLIREINGRLDRIKPERR